MTHSIDECPASGCRCLVRGIDAGLIFEGSHYTCTRGHTLVARVIAGRAYLVQVRKAREQAERAERIARGGGE